MLGFSELVESNPVSREAFQEIERGGETLTNDAIVKAANGNPLVDIYARFLRTLHMVKTSTFSSHNNSTVIAFSDSAFVAVPYFLNALYLGRDIMRECIRQKIPVRMGIGGGSFLILGFGSDVRPTNAYNSASFLGTAVVRAHRAEKCGIKGFRILLHPSVAESSEYQHLLKKHEKPSHCHVIRCGDDEVSNSTGVTMECNYLYLRGGGPGEPLNIALRDSLNDMLAEAPSTFKHQYTASVAALDRMAAAVGPLAFK